jgi:hypothetical protein
MKMKSALAIFAVTFAFYSSAMAQAPTATLVGTVRDSLRAVIVGAEVNVRDVNTNAARVAKTDAQGEYTISGLDPSTYDVIISKASFREVENPSITLAAEQTARFDVVLPVGSVKQEVVVTTEVGVLNTESGEKGDVVSPVEISEMPLDGRDFSDLVFNVAGVAPAEEGTKGSPFVAGGARSDATNIIVDGMNNTSPRDSTAEAAPPLDALQEFKVSTSGYSAEYGRVAGPVVNLVIKKGGNTLHGSFFEFVRNDLFDGSNYFDVPGSHSELRRNQFGGTIGGPVYIPHLYNGHNKTFFLVSEESYRDVAGSNSISVVPTLLERKGDFSQSVDTYTGTSLAASGVLLSNPLASGKTPTILPNYQVPQSMWDPLSAQLLNFYPLPNYWQPTSGGFGNNYITNKKTYENWDNVVVKLDQQLHAHDEASIRWLYRKETEVNPFAGSPLGLWGSKLHNAQTIVGITETHIFNPNLINEFRSGLTRNVNDERELDSGTNWAASMGIVGTTTVPSQEQFPTLKPTGYASLGDSEQEPVTFTTNNYDTNDTMTWNHGKHTVKFGGSMLRIQYFQPTNSQFSGTFTFNGRNSGANPPVPPSTAPTSAKNNGNAMAEFLLGSASSAGLRQGTVVNHLFEEDYAGYIQDDYKILDRLTLNLGLRYEFQSLMHEENGQISSYDPYIPNPVGGTGQPNTNVPGVVLLGGDQAVCVPNSNPAVCGDAAVTALAITAGAPGLILTAAQEGLPSTIINPNKLRFAPRVGWAWRPSINNSLVVRGSYGIFFTGSRLSALRTQLSGNFPFSFSPTFTSTKSTLFQYDLQNQMNYKPYANGYDENAPSSYLESYNLTVEKELPKGLAVEVAYSGSKGIHLGWQVDINQLNQLDPTYILTGGIRPNMNFTTINFFQFNAYSSYNAGTITVRKRFEHGLLFRANYTWAKNLDMNSALNYAGAGGYQGAQDSNNQQVEYGRSDADRRNVFNGNFVYALPFNRNFFVKGWQMAGSWQVESGTPFTPQYNGGEALTPIDATAGHTSQTDGGATRPDRVCNGSIPTSQRTVGQFFNATQTGPNACFTNPGTDGVVNGHFGNSRRNILDGPGLYTVNWSISRNFRITNSGKLQFRWEIFNLLNHPNFNLPNDNLDEIGAGSITKAHDPRAMQLGAKYTF